MQHKLPLCFDVMVKALKADRAGHMMHFFDSAIRGATTTGTLIEGGLGGRALDTIDPVNIEAMLNSQFKDFCLGARSKNFLPLLGYGIFTQDGPDWRLSRELLRPQFMHTKSEYFAFMQNETERLVRTLVTSPVQSGVDLSPLFFALTLHTTTSVLFGRSSGSMTSIDDDPDAFAKAFNEGQHLLALRARMGKVWWMLDGPGFRAHCRTVRRYVDEVVDAALAEDRDIEKEGPTRNYVFLRALISRTKNPKFLRDQLINILLAGRDTTACLLSWTFRLLAAHPETQSKLRAECLALPSFAAGSIPTKEEIKSMPYLEVVIREVLRLYPSVPVNTREAVRTTTLPRGGGPDGQSPVIVRKGETVGYAVYTMHRSPEIYGSDANDFRPERWIEGEPNHVNIKQLGWGYLPFNGGPRICLGRKPSFQFLSFFQKPISPLSVVTYLTRTWTACQNRGVRNPRGKIHNCSYPTVFQPDRMGDGTRQLSSGKATAYACVGAGGWV